MVSIGRGVGAWGDMVITLNDGSKIEMRSLPKCVAPLLPTPMCGGVVVGLWWVVWVRVCLCVGV